MSKNLISSLIILGIIILPGCAKETPAIDQPEEQVIEDTTVPTADISFNELSELDFATVAGDNAEQILADYKNYYGADFDTPFYSFGTVTDPESEYIGQQVLIINIPCEGPCFSPTLYRFLWDEAVLTYLPQYSTEYMPDYLSLLTKSANSTVKFASLEAPETLAIPNSDEVFGLEQVNALFIYDEWHGTPEALQNYDLAFTDPELGDILGYNGCLYVQMGDGSLARYGYDPGFFDGTATWNDSTTTDFSAYQFMPSGCGIIGNCYLLKNVDSADLTLAGTTNKGVKLYTVTTPIENPIESDTLAQKDFYEAYAGYEASNSWKVENEGFELMTFDDFTAKKSVIYWQDPLGRWSTIVSTEIAPMAECGKPVIYLYPEETTDVSVKVNIDEMTVSIPDYNDGWLVQATPEGEIYNYADGKNYEYLFWEGNKKSAETNVTSGFVVEKNSLKPFLTDSLHKLGLSKQESADFLEFWLPNMQKNSSPFFLISFLGTSEFNRIAPLEITPTPDTLIRVFMYFEPLNKKIEIAPQTLSTIPRNGFTVIEWGGTLR